MQTPYPERPGTVHAGSRNPRPIDNNPAPSIHPQATDFTGNLGLSPALPAGSNLQVISGLHRHPLRVVVSRSPDSYPGGHQAHGEGSPSGPNAPAHYGGPGLNMFI